MKLSRRAKIYIFINICLIAACIVFASLYDKATKKFKAIDKNDKDYNSLQNQRKLWGWLAIAMLIIIFIVNWRTCLFIIMIAITFLASDSPDFTVVSSGLLANDLSNRRALSKNYQTVNK